MPESPARTLAFTTAVCVVCSLLVSGVAVGLEGRQHRNRVLDQRRHVLRVAGLRRYDERLSPAEVDARFAALEPRTVQVAGADHVVYLVHGDRDVETLVLPIEGKGLWSTLKGYLALSAYDGRTVRGITYYSHAETPGLGGQIDDPRWQSHFQGRLAYDTHWKPALTVAKGPAGSLEDDPYRVDGISGATITGDCVSRMLHRWLGKRGFGPWLAAYRAERGIR